MNIKFILPDFYLWEEYADLLDEYTDGGPWTLFREYATAGEFEQVIHRTNRAALGIGVGEHAPCVTYWVRDVDAGRLVGAVNIRYYLTKQGFDTWGHIGFGVRPSERCKGYATAILRMALKECLQMKMERVLIGCRDDNEGSWRTIERCGGVLENRVHVTDHDGTAQFIRRYWVIL